MNNIVSRAFDKYGRMSANGYLDGTIEVSINGKIGTDKLYYHTEPVYEIAFSDFGDTPTLISGCYGGYLVVWKIVNGKWKNVFMKEYNIPIISIAAGKTKFAVVLKNSTIETYSYENIGLLKSYAENQVFKIAFMLDSDNLVVASNNGKIKYLEASESDVQVTNSKIIAIAANKSNICVACSDGTVRVVMNSITEIIPRDTNTKPIGCFWDVLTDSVNIVFQKSVETWIRLPNGSWVIE